MIVKVFRPILVVFVVVLSGYGVYKNQLNREPLSDIMAANVEALAADESGIGGDCTRYLGCQNGAMDRCGNVMLVMSFIHTFGCDYGGDTCSPRVEVNYYNCDRVLTGTEICPRIGFCY